MADDSTISIGLQGDASDLQSASDEGVSAIDALINSIDELRNSMDETSSRTIEGFDNIGESTRQTGESLGVLAGAADGLQSLFGSMIASIAAVFSVETIKSWVDQVATSAVEFHNLSARIGAADADMQTLDVAARMNGVSLNTVAMGLTRLDFAYRQAGAGNKQLAKDFADLGVRVGQHLNQMELLRAVMDGMKDMSSGPEKAAIAYQILGRAGAQLIPFLSQGREGLAEMAKMATEYGFNLDGLTDKTYALGKAHAELGVALQGLSNMAMDALAPALTAVVTSINQFIASIIQSYREGGAWRTILQGAVGAVQIAWTALKAVGDVLATLFRTLTDIVDALTGGFLRHIPVATQVNIVMQVIKLTVIELADVVLGLALMFEIAVDRIAMYAKQIANDLGALATAWDAISKHMGQVAVDLGRVLYDGLTHNFAAAGKDFNTLAGDMGDVGGQIGAAFAKAGQQGQEAWTKGQQQIQAAIANTRAQADDLNKTMFGGFPKAPPSTAGAGAGMTGAPGGGKEKSQMDQYRLALEQLEMGVLETKQTWLANMDQLELDYWSGILDHLSKGSKDYAEVYKTWFELLKKTNGDAQKALIQEDQERLQADRDNHDKEVADWAKLLNDLEAAYTKDSEQYRKAKADEAKYEEEFTKKHLEEVQKREMAEAQSDQRIANLYLQARDTMASIGQTTLDRELATQQISVASWYAQSIAMVRQKYDQEEAIATDFHKRESEDLLTSALNAGATFGWTSDQYLAATQKMDQADQIFTAEESVRRANAAREMATVYNKAVDDMIAKTMELANALVNSIGSSISGLIMRTETWHQAFIRVLTDMLNAVIRLAEQWVISQIKSMLMGVAQKKLEGVHTITASAAEAGAGGVASMAAAPWPLDMTAPAFGAQMAAAALAYIPMLGFASGLWEVPTMMPAVLHPGETVLPAAAAERFREAGEGGVGGDVHAHFHIHGAMDGPSFRNFLRANQLHISTVLQEMGRKGMPLGYAGSS